MFNNNEMFQSICWTMVHSLWQGIVLAMLAGTVIVLTRKTSAALRYNLLALLGTGFIFCVAITFYIQIQANEPVTSLSSPLLESSQDVSPVLVTYNHHLQQQRQTVMGSVAGFFDHNAPYIVALWFLVFVFKCTRLLRGLHQVQRMRHRHVFAVSAQWNQRLEELKSLLHIKGPVKLAESAMIKAPAVIGFFKPVILLPIGLLANMPAAETEAILLHELAHIHRRDYLANLVQGLGEIIFFFNPGFIWVSSLIKTERENCCDDMAVAITQSKTGFVKALVYSQEYGWNRNQLALGFGRKKTPLLDRAKRILHNNNQTLNQMEKTFLSLCVVLGLCVAFAFAGNGQQDSVLNKQLYPNGTPEVSPTPINKDSLYEAYPGQHFKEGTYIHYNEQVNGHNQEVYLFKHAGVTYQVSGDIRELKVDGKIIPQSQWNQYLPKVEALLDEYRDGLRMDVPDSLDIPDGLAPPAPPSPPCPPNAPFAPLAPTAPLAPVAPLAPLSPPAWIGNQHYFSNLLNGIPSRREDSLRKKEIEAAQRQVEVEMKKLSEEMRQMEMEMAKAGKVKNKEDRDMMKHDMDMKKHDLDMKKHELDMKKADIEILKANEEMRKAEIEMVKADAEMRKAEIEMEKAQLEMEKADREMQKTMERMKPIETKHDNIPAAILTDLKSRFKDITSYDLSDKELLVNGKKQPATLHQEFCKKYINGKMSVRYNLKDGKKSTSISID